jgi:dihydroorotase
MGIVGIETAFPISYTYLVKTGIITLERLIELLSVKPRERFGITSDAGFCIFDLGDEYSIDPEDFISAGKSTPFEGWRVHGRCLATVYNGKVVYASEKLGKRVNKTEEI